MCLSASVSYGAAALLISLGAYNLHLARQHPPSYWPMACTPLFFGLQQAFEGRVWQLIDSGDAGSSIPFALGFLFFSHFFWLWWIPLGSFLLESGRVRKRIFLGFTLFGGAAGGLVFITLLLHPSWIAVTVKHHSIIYDISSPIRGPFSIGIPPSALYALTVLIPLLFSSHRHIRIYGCLIAASMVLASLAYGYAFVSVWCFFAALLSIYLVYMTNRFLPVSS